MVTLRDTQRAFSSTPSGAVKITGCTQQQAELQGAFDAAAAEEEVAAYAAAGYVPALTVSNGGRSLLRVYVPPGE